jgi:hypothetical protein
VTYQPLIEPDAAKSGVVDVVGGRASLTGLRQRKTLWFFLPVRVDSNLPRNDDQETSLLDPRPKLPSAAGQLRDVYILLLRSAGIHSFVLRLECVASFRQGC